MKNKEDSNYDFIASFYDIIIGPFLKHIRKQVVEITHLEEHDSVLEVASGTGEQAVIFTRRGTTVTGLDISDAMLKIARHLIGPSNTGGTYCRRPSMVTLSAKTVRTRRGDTGRRGEPHFPGAIGSLIRLEQ